MGAAVARIMPWNLCSLRALVILELQDMCFIRDEEAEKAFVLSSDDQSNSSQYQFSISQSPFSASSVVTFRKPSILTNPSN
jgi:hypothetical protein